MLGQLLVKQKWIFKTLLDKPSYPTISRFRDDELLNATTFYYPHLKVYMQER